MTRVPSAEASLNAPKILGLLAMIVACSAYLGGYLFLVFIKSPEPWRATPITLLQYWEHYGDRVDIRQKILYAGGGSLATLLVTGVLLAIPRRRPLHGDARFATKGEIRKAGLLADKGIILGRFKNQILMLSGQQGVLLEAPPRSGKGVGVIIPNLLNWPDSVIVNDIKGENWTRTAGYRAAHGHATYRFDPLAVDECTACWNPFDYVSDVNYRRIGDVMGIASMLFEESDKDKFWSNSAATLFLGISLYLFEKPGTKCTVGEVLRQGMAADGEGFKQHWTSLIQMCQTAGYTLSREAQQALYDSIDLAPVTASSVRKTFTSTLSLWANPMIDAATARSDFDLRALRKKPISIYCCTNPKNIERLRPLLNLFWQQAIGLQTTELPEDNPALTRQLLLCMDEFAALGNIPIIAHSTAFLPGYNVRALVVVQSFDQLVQIYSMDGAKALRKMLAARIVFPPKEYDDAEAISRELGTYTVKQKSRTSKPLEAHSASVNVSEQPRRLLMAQEVKELGNERAIIMYEGLRPFVATKIRYFKDKLFTSRLLRAPVVIPLDVEGHYSRQQHTPSQEKITPPAKLTSPTADGGEGLSNAIELDAEMSEAPEITPAHVDALATGSLSDVLSALDDIELPKERPLSDDEIQSAVDSFFDTLAE
ncbi:type IV secretory system conjugative DNA transfer family protein [Zoogloeaceae bacterium G21618-S1]|nr:type IV secretory system conjugative DNA transfer family protein [Zoogloeaceae bacterium G21618-S1]